VAAGAESIVEIDGAMAAVVASSAVTAVVEVVITGAVVVVADGEGGVAAATAAGAGDVAAAAPCFFRSSFQHLEQQSPVALLPKKPQAILQSFGSEGVDAVVSLESFILLMMIISLLNGCEGLMVNDDD